MAVNYLSLNERPDGQIRRRGKTPRIGDQPRTANPLPAKLRQPISRFGEQRRLSMNALVPLLVPFRSAQPKRAADVDDFHSSVEQPRREIDRHLSRRGQKYGRQLLGP